MRPGARLQLVARTAKTYVKKQHKDFGNGVQLVVGEDAELTATPFTLRHLPLHGCVEVYAVPLHGIMTKCSMPDVLDLIFSRKLEVVGRVGGLPYLVSGLGGDYCVGSTPDFQKPNTVSSV